MMKDELPFQGVLYPPAVFEKSGSETRAPFGAHEAPQDPFLLLELDVKFLAGRKLLKRVGVPARCFVRRPRGGAFDQSRRERDDVSGTAHATRECALGTRAAAAVSNPVAHTRRPHAAWAALRFPVPAVNAPNGGRSRRFGRLDIYGLSPAPSQGPRKKRIIIVNRR